MALLDRVKNILLTPKTEWEVIDAEPTTVGDLYRSYIMPLAAIGPVAQAIGSTVFGYTVPFLGTYRTPVGSAITMAVVSYVLALAGIYVLSLIIDALAPTFDGTRNQIQALKVAAYSATASWIAGVFALIPMLGFLALLGLYSLYLMYLGLPLLMKSPKEKAVAYTAVVIIAAIVLFMATSLIAGMFLAAPAGFGR